MADPRKQFVESVAKIISKSIAGEDVADDIAKIYDDIEQHIWNCLDDFREELLMELNIRSQLSNDDGGATSADTDADPAKESSVDDIPALKFAEMIKKSQNKIAPIMQMYD